MSKTKRKEKKERVDFIMRKSIKKMAAAMLTATMLMGLGTTAFAADLDTASIPAGTFVYTLIGNMTSWESMDDANVMQQAKDVNGNDIAGVYSMDITMPAYDEESQWASRFAICAYANDDEVDGANVAWQRIVLGDTAATKKNVLESLGKTCLTNIRVETAEETPVTVYFDSTTNAVVIRDKDNNDIPYKVGWITNDDNETYYSLEELSAMSLDDFVAGLNETDRKGDVEALGITAIPDFAAINSALSDKIDGKYVEPTTEETTVAEETTTVADETTAAAAEETTVAAPAATTAAPAAKAATATTAANQSTKTGDVAPVALFAVLVAAVAVVTVAAKKKEA